MRGTSDAGFICRTPRQCAAAAHARRHGDARPAIRYAARLCSRCAQLRSLPRSAAGYGNSRGYSPVPGSSAREHCRDAWSWRAIHASCPRCWARSRWRTRRLSLNRRYQRTHNMMTSRSKCRPSNSLLYALQLAHCRTSPSSICQHTGLRRRVCNGPGDDLPARIGPGRVQFPWAPWSAVRCPSELAPLMHKVGRAPHSRRSGGSILRLLAIASYFAASSSSALEMSSSVTREAMRL